jgi:hypothetical protein
VLIAALLFLAAATFAMRGPAGLEPPATVTFAPSSADPAPEAEVELAIVEPNGLERTAFVMTRVPTEDAARYAAVFAALREELVGLGVWPEDVPAPGVFVQRVAGSEVVILDLQVPEGASLAAATELRLVRSIDATAARHDAVVRYLVNGSAAPTLLGHVAVPGALDVD